MRRFIAKIADGRVLTDERLNRHARVIRLKKGERVEFVTEAGESYSAHVGSTDPLEFTLDGRLEISRELPFNLVFLAPLLKGDNFDFLLQKATELGAGLIIPYISARTVVRLGPAAFAAKAPRYRRIIEEAVEQSNRDRIPVLESLQTLSALELPPFAEEAFVAYEEEALVSSVLPSDYRPEPGSTVVAMIGPEGGFAPSEIEVLSRLGFRAISLGKRIMRAETAACTLLAVLAYKGESR